MESPMSDWSRIFEPFDINIPPQPAIVEEIPTTYGSSRSLEYYSESRANCDREDVISIGTRVTPDMANG